MVIHLCLVLESSNFHLGNVMILLKVFRMLNTLPTKIQNL